MIKESIMTQPRYMAVVDWVKKELEKGNLKPGDRLDSENELSVKFSLSRQTIRHAIAVLEKEGYVTRIQGSGTYISDNNITDKVNRKNIAVITTYVDAYIFPQMIQHVERVLSNAGYTVQISFTYNRISREKSILEGIVAKDDIAGVIAEPTKSSLPNPNLKYYEKLRKKHVPVLFMNTYYEALDAPHVSMDDIMAGKIATQYVIGKGHKRIGGVFKLDDSQGSRRYFGFLEAMNEASLRVTGNDLLWFDTVDIENEENVRQLAERIRKRLSTRTALVLYNDESAYKLINEFNKMGLKIPDDISIVGIDDTVLSTNGTVQITSVAYPTEEIAVKAANNLLELIKNGRFDATYEFSVHIVERDSVKDLTDNQTGIHSNLIIYKFKI